MERPTGSFFAPPIGSSSLPPSQGLRLQTGISLATLSRPPRSPSCWLRPSEKLLPPHWLLPSGSTAHFSAGSSSRAAPPHWLPPQAAAPPPRPPLTGATFEVVVRLGLEGLRPLHRPQLALLRRPPGASASVLRPLSLRHRRRAVKRAALTTSEEGEGDAEVGGTESRQERPSQTPPSGNRRGAEPARTSSAREKEGGVLLLRMRRAEAG